MATKQVFLSYAHLDRKQARRLYEDVSSSDAIRVWFDEHDLLPGLKWRPAIRKAIRESRYFIPLMSKRSVSSRGFRHTELRQALEVLDEFPDDYVYLIPTRLNECEPPDERLEALTYADLFPSWDRGVDRLKRSLRISGRPSLTRRKLAKPAQQPKYRVQLTAVGLPTRTLREVAHGLNEIQTHFSFTASSLGPGRNALRVSDGEPQLDLDKLGKSFYEKVTPLKMDRIYCITDRFLMFEEGRWIYSNYLWVPSSVDERVAFFSTAGLKDHARKAGVSYEVALAFSLVSGTVAFFLDLDYHRSTRSCPMDFTEVHSEVVKGLKKGRFCQPCLRKLDRNKSLKRAVQAMLRWGR